MSKIRRRALPSNHFTIIANGWLRDAELSWAARGLLGWLASHAIGYDISEEMIIGAAPAGRGAGRDGVRAMVRELEKAGYLRRDKTFTPGVGSTVDYVLTDPDDGSAVPTDDGSTVARDEQGKQPSAPGRPDDGSAVAHSLSEDQEKTIGETSSPRDAALIGEIVDDQALIPASVGAALEVAEPPNAGVITRRWIDHCTANGVRLTSTAIKRYGAQVKQALADGFDDKLVRHALAAMLADRVASRPAMLDIYLIRVQQGPEMPPARLTHHQADAERRAAEAGTTATARLYDTLTRDA